MYGPVRHEGSAAGVLGAASPDESLPISEVRRRQRMAGGGRVLVVRGIRVPDCGHSGHAFSSPPSAVATAVPSDVEISFRKLCLAPR